MSVCFCSCSSVHLQVQPTIFTVSLGHFFGFDSWILKKKFCYGVKKPICKCVRVHHAPFFHTLSGPTKRKNHMKGNLMYVPHLVGFSDESSHPPLPCEEGGLVRYKRLARVGKREALVSWGWFIIVGIGREKEKQLLALIFQDVLKPRGRSA